jgi:hypothetical protein
VQPTRQGCAHQRKESEKIMSVADELRRVAQLHSDGHLTGDEFAAAKDRILAGVVTTGEEPRRRDPDVVDAD